MTIAIGLALLFAMTAINVPIAIGLGLLSVIGIISTEGWDNLVNLPLTMFSGTTSFPLLAIPLFIFAGALMNTSSISRRLIGFVAAVIGFVRGGLAMVTVGVSMIFAEISGSGVADVAALGSVLIPAMKRRNYTKEFSAAITSSAASLAIIIPPSIAMILYGALSDTSIVQLFVAGFLPGILGGIGLMALSYWFAVRHNLAREEAFHVRRLWAAFKDAWLTLLLPVIILGGIFSGLVTATEAAGLAVVVAFVISGIIYRELNWSLLRGAMVEGIVQTAVVMLLVATSAVLGQYLTELQLPQKLANAIIAETHDKWLVLAMLNVLLLVLGMFLHGAAAIILVVPIVMPLIHQLGIDPVHFGIVLTLNIAVGQQTPPVASVLITACTIAKSDIWETTKVNVWFIAVLLATLFLVTYVPAIPMTLVHLFYR